MIAFVSGGAPMELLHGVSAMTTLSAAAAIALEAWNGNLIVAGGDLFRVDALSVLMVAIIALLGAIASLYAVGYIRANSDDAHLPRVDCFALFHVFIFTMLVAVTTDNLGVMWIAVEGTTFGDGLPGQPAPPHRPPSCGRDRRSQADSAEDNQCRFFT